MALPVISHNTPVAGSITWTEFNIQYNGQSFIIPAGTTAQSFVWWLYGGGTAPALQAGNAIPNLGAEDMILFLNKGGIGVLVPTAELLDGSLIVGGSILAGAIGANQIQTTHLSANAVTAGQIAANSVTATQIAAGSVTADKLSVGTVSDNMVVNGSFEDALSGMLVGWEAYTISNGTIQPVTGVSSSGAVAMQFVCTNTSANLRVRQLPAQYIPVSAASGRKYYISTRAGASTATTSGHYMRVNWYDGNKALISSVDVRVNGALTTTFTLYEGQVTPPATARYMGMDIIITNVNVATTIYVDEVSAHEVTMSAQIGDGQITTPKLVANAVVANTIAAGAVTADKLTISDFQNYLPGGNFDNANDVLNFTLGVGQTLDTTNQYAGTGCLASAASAGARQAVPKNKISVVPGDQYYIGFYWKSSADYAGASGNAKLRVGDQNGTFLTQITYTVADTVWKKKELFYTIPAGVTQLSVTLSFDHTVGTAWMDSVQVRRMNGGELIVDGAIYASKIATDAVTTDKLIANAITGIKIAANAITAREVAANAIYANHIMAGEIKAAAIASDAIDGKTITGATIQTSATNPRIVMDATKFEGYDASGNRYIKMDSTGLSQTGVFSTILADKATSFQVGVPEATLTGNGPTGTVGGVPGFAFIQGSRAYADSPRLFSYSNGLSLDMRGGGTDYNEGILQVSSGGVYAISGDSSFELGAARTFLKYNDSNYMSLTGTYGLSVTASKFTVNSKRVPIGLLSLQRLTGVTTVTTTDTQLSSVTVSGLSAGMVLEVSGSYAGGPSGASNQYLSWSWKANGVRFAENSHRSNASGFGEGDSFSGFYTVPAGQTSVTISLWGIVAAGGGTYVCPADTNSPKLQYAIKDIGDA